ncbi:MAG: hypothetical protein M1820_007590 [Bogoriella megaspora]|nr:MAG: hypothetical protein M1820_007590 [Bogoriella megaspora]
MHSYALLALAAVARLAQAHTVVFNVYVNGKDQGLGSTQVGGTADAAYIRSPPNNNPVKDITSADMACNVNNVAQPSFVAIKPGDNVTFEWHHNGETADDDIIASSHKGPVQVYMAPITDSEGSGPIWQKIAAQGYDPSSKLWAVDDLISAKGKHSITVPNVADGKYFLRPEIIALHEADTLYSAAGTRGAQFYMECVQFEVSGGSGDALPKGVSFPGAYTDEDPGVHFNLYGSFSTYALPGPTVWSAGAAAATGAPTSAAATSAAATSAAATSAAAAPTSSVVADSSVSAPSSSVVESSTEAAASSVAAPTSVAAPAAGTFVNSITGSLVWIYTPTGATGADAAATSSVAVSASDVAVPTTLATSVKPTSAAAAPSASSGDEGDDCDE